MEELTPIYRSYGYNPDRDLVAVSQTDVLNIADCFVNGLIPDNIVAPDGDYDNNEDPRTILGRPANEFEAIHLLETVKSVAPSSETKQD